MSTLKERQHDRTLLEKMIANEMQVDPELAHELLKDYILQQQIKRNQERLKARKLSNQKVEEFNKKMEQKAMQENIERIIEYSDEEYKEELLLNYPKYFNVREVSLYKGITPQQVRRNCINGKYQAEQVAGENSSWRILTDQFKEENDFFDFIQQRAEKFKKVSKASQMAVELWTESQNGIQIEHKNNE